MAQLGRKTKYKVLSKSTINVGLLYLSFITHYLLLPACNGDKKPSTQSNQEQSIQTPAFDADSAYSFLKTQVDMGPRVPGTKAHAQCADYLQSKLKSYGWQVILQTADIKT